MKKLVKGIIALCLTLSCFFGVVSCAEYEGNSKIQRITITLDVNGESQDFNFKLYDNYAPGTIAHFTDLANGGYYTDTAVSNLDGHVEFGAYYYKDDALLSKYDANADKDIITYSKIIDANYMKNKYVGPGKNPDYERYLDGGFVRGEFASAGVEGNPLDLNGALILKRDVYGEDHEISPEAYHTARATMAVSFTGDGYFTSSKDFAIIGKICTDDGDKSSATRLKDLMDKYKEDADGNVYYHYTYVTGERTDSYGNFFMYNKEDGAYYAQDEYGEYTVKLERDTDDEDAPVNVLLDEIAKYDEYVNVLPYGDVKITVKKITFNK